MVTSESDGSGLGLSYPGHDADCLLNNRAWRHFWGPKACDCSHSHAEPITYTAINQPFVQPHTVVGFDYLATTQRLADAHTKNEDTMQKNNLTVTPDDIVSLKVYGVIALEDPAEDPRQELIDHLWRILQAIELAENFSLRIGVDEKVPAPYGAIFIQVRCWRRDVITGKWGFGWGGKATVSPFQTDSEIVGMAFGLYKSYFEHEARETFKWEGKRVYGPHIDIRALHSIASKVDVRSAQHTTDKL